MARASWVRKVSGGCGLENPDVAEKHLHCLRGHLVTASACGFQVVELGSMGGYDGVVNCCPLEGLTSWCKGITVAEGRGGLEAGWSLSWSYVMMTRRLSQLCLLTSP